MSKKTFALFVGSISLHTYLQCIYSISLLVKDVHEMHLECLLGSIPQNNRRFLDGNGVEERKVLFNGVDGSPIAIK